MRVWRYCLCGRRWAGLTGVFVALCSLGLSAQGAEQESVVERIRAELVDKADEPQAIARIAELLHRESLTSPGRTLAILREFVDGKTGPKADPLVLAQAAYRLSLEEDRQGAFAEAEAHRKDLGLLNDAWVLGPFDAQGRGAVDRPCPVEVELSRIDPRAAASYPGKERNVSWRRAPAQAFVQGALRLDALLRPDSDAMAYLLAYVKSDRDRWVALRIGSPGPVKAWLGGAVVWSSSAVRPPEIDQDAAPIPLRRGDNLLVVKTVVTRGDWRLFVRLTEPDGRPLAGVSTSAVVPKHQVGAPGKPAGAKSVRDLAKLLRQRAQGRGAGEAAAQAWLDWALFLSLVSPLDQDLRATEEAAQRAVAVAGKRLPRPAVQALLLLGEVAREEDDRRAALEKALPAIADPGEKALVLSATGQIWHEQRRDQTAIACWQQAVSIDRDCIPAQLALARQEEMAGLTASALRRLESLPMAARELPRVARDLADVLSSLGRRADAEKVNQEAYRAERTDVTLLRELAAAARARGDLAAASRWYGEAARWRPDLTSLVLSQAAILEGQGDFRSARDLFLAAIERLPDDPGLPEELGRLQARAGHLQEAAASMRRSLELRPQNPNLRRYLEALVARAKKSKDASTIDRLASENAADSEAIVREALFAAPSDADVAPAEVVLDRTVVRVHRNGLSERFVQRLVHFRTDRAASDGQEVWIQYEPGRQEVEVRKARIWRRGKDRHLEVSEATGRDERDLSEPWYGLYYDSRAEIVLFENLRAGDVVEIQYSLADVAYRNEFADYFGDFQMVADAYPARRWDYTLIAPKGRTFYFNSPRFPGLVSETSARGDETVYHFGARHVARVESEPAMPGFAEVAPYLHVSTYRTWEDVGRWYWRLIADQMQDDGTLKKAALAATAGLSSTLDKVRAIHRLVVEKTRYVGLEFGIHGYLPYKATQVFERGFGDCKDKATLLIALLRTIGIDSEIVLLRTRQRGRIDDKPASLAAFDHAITYVPALDLYLDGTAEFSGLAELPAQDQDAMALRVFARGATLVRTPLLPAQSNEARRRWSVDLKNDGSARIAEDVTITGQAAHEWREHYQAGGERRERYAKVWNGRYAGSVLDQVAMNVSDRNRPVAVHALVRVPRLGERRSANQIDLPLSSREADFTSTYARLGQRQWPLVLGYPWRHEEEVTYRLPDGARIVRAPASQKIASRFGEFTLSLDERSGGKVAVKTALVVDKSRIEPSEYPAFRSFLRDTDALLAGRLIVQVKGAP
jgi:tetratricopeptide (TPR) repeat protein